MATVRLAGTFPINSGSFTDYDTDSCCYIPGSSGYTSVFFGVSLSLRIAVTTENEVYVALNGGRAAGDKPGLTKGSQSWVMNWGYSKHTFSLSNVGGLPNRTQLGNMTVTPDPCSDGTATAYYNFPSTSAVTVGADASALSSWRHVGNVSDLERNGDYFYFYVAFPVQNTNGEVDFDVLNAYRVVVSDPSVVPAIWEYYPWARMVSSEWWSHNRNGGSLTRYEGSGWADVKNIQNSPSQSDGFRYSGSSWNESPITGRES